MTMQTTHTGDIEVAGNDTEMYLKNYLESPGNLVDKRERMNRLSEIVGDYLTDESVDARNTYEEILQEVNFWINYHSQHMTKAKKLRSLLMGESDLTL
jgi:hypothetical protein